VGWLSVSRSRPRLELTVGIEEGAKYLRDEGARVYGVAVDMLVIASIAFEAGVQVASQPVSMTRT
jgi:hypothetical protein